MRPLKRVIFAVSAELADAVNRSCYVAGLLADCHTFVTKLTWFCSVVFAPLPAMRKNETNRQAAWLTSLLLIPAVLCADNALCADAASANNASDASDLLLNLFIEKGYVSKAEAEKVKAEAEKRQAELDQYKAEAEQYKTETEQLKADVAQLKANEESYRTNAVPSYLPAAKWKINPGDKSIELFGDIRMRYEDRQIQDPKGNKVTWDRLRYSLRLGMRGEVFDDVYYGFRLETSSNPRSSFNTLGTPTGSSTAQYPNPFTKNNETLNVGEAYIGLKYGGWLDVVMGKMPNPLFTSTMVWSPAISPSGAAETLTHAVGDMDLSVTLGQFIYQATNPNQSSQGFLPQNANNSSQPFLMAFQGKIDYHLTKTVNFKVAPVLYYYTRYQNGQNPSANGAYYSPDFSGTYVGQGQKVGVNGVPASYNLAGSTPGFDGYYANQTGINDLLVLDIPLEVSVNLKKVKVRFYGDYAQNLQGKERADAAYNAANSFYFSDNGPGAGQINPINSPQTHDIRAYQFGIGVGSTNLIYGPSQGLVYGNESKKNAWEVRTYWQHIEQYSLDPNLIDSDFFNATENEQGVYAAIAYGLFDNVIATVRYGYARRINDQLGTGGSSGDLPQMNPLNCYSIFQFDLGVRF